MIRLPSWWPWTKGKACHECFASGYREAWAQLRPLFAEGLATAKQQIREEAIDSTLKNLESVIQQRLDAAGKIHLRPQNDLLAKQAEFVNKMTTAQTQDDKIKYSHYLEALSWLLNVH